MRSLRVAWWVLVLLLVVAWAQGLLLIGGVFAIAGFLTGSERCHTIAHYVLRIFGYALGYAWNQKGGKK